MSKAEKSTSLQKDLRKEVTQLLETSLGKMKEYLGERKFNNRIRKASKLLTEGVGQRSKKVKKEALKAPLTTAKSKKNTASKKVTVTAEPSEKEIKAVKPVVAKVTKKAAPTPKKVAAKK